jgi:hypothetical protein
MIARVALELCKFAVDAHPFDANLKTSKTTIHGCVSLVI